MSQSSNNPNEQEIDLAAISKSVGSFFQSFGTRFFNIIQFFIRNIIIVLILVITGGALGFYLDKTQKSFDNRLIVMANFSSVDYLYSKVDLLNSKLKKNDSIFLKGIGMQKPNNIRKIEIKPIIDIYSFINRSEQNFDLLKLMSEDGDLKKIVEESPTSKNYPYHLIYFTSKKPITDKSTVEPIMDFLNNSEYYSRIQKEAIANIKSKIQANDTIIHQIDGVLNGMADLSGKNAKTVYINENTQLNDVIETKDKLVKEQGDNRIALINTEKVIKKCSEVINIENEEALGGNYKLLLPLLFIIIFSGLRAFRAFYRKQSLKAQQNSL